MRATTSLSTGSCARTALSGGSSRRGMSSPTRTGCPVELVGVIQDITDRRRAEEKARGVESQLRMLAENSRDLIFRYRILPDPGFEFVSPASVAITGYTPDEFYAQPELINHLIDAAARDLWMGRVGSGHVNAAVDLEIVRKDGTKIWVNQSLVAVLDADGEVIGMDGITRDVSDRKVSRTAARARGPSRSPHRAA